MLSDTGLSLAYAAIPSSPLLVPSSTFKHPRDYIRPTQIIQVTLTEACSLATLISPVTFIVLCRVIYHNHIFQGLIRRYLERAIIPPTTLAALILESADRLKGYFSLMKLL